MGGHYVLQEQVAKRLPLGGVIRTAMENEPECAAWGSFGPDLGYGCWGTLLGAGLLGGETVAPWADAWHYELVGTFCTRLLQNALASGDQEQIAFAAGWVTHVIGDLWVHGFFVNKWAGGVFFDAPETRDFHGKLEFAADPILWTLRGGHTEGEFSRFGGYPERYGFPHFHDFRQLVVTTTQQVYGGRTSPQPEWIAGLTYDEFTDMCLFLFNTVILTDAQGLPANVWTLGNDGKAYQSLATARERIAAGGAREEALLRAFDEATAQAVGLLSGAEVGDYHGFSDSWNADLGEVGTAADVAPHNAIGTLTVRTYTPWDAYAGTDDDVFFKWGSLSDAWWSKELDIGTVWHDDFDRGDVDDYHLLVKRDWYYLPHLLSEIKLEKDCPAYWDDQWRPSDVWLFVNGREAAHFGYGDWGWFRRGTWSRWGKALDMSAWTPPDPVSGLQASLAVAANGSGTATLTFTKPPGSRVRVLRSAYAYATRPTDVANSQRLVTDDATPAGTADVGLQNGTRYYYTVYTQNAQGVWQSPPEGARVSVFVPAKTYTPTITMEDFSWEPEVLRVYLPATLRFTLKNTGPSFGISRGELRLTHVGTGWVAFSEPFALNTVLWQGASSDFAVPWSPTIAGTWDVAFYERDTNWTSPSLASLSVGLEPSATSLELVSLTASTCRLRGVVELPERGTRAGSGAIVIHSSADSAELGAATVRSDGTFSLTLERPRYTADYWADYRSDQWAGSASEPVRVKGTSPNAVATKHAGLARSGTVPWGGSYVITGRLLTSGGRVLQGRTVTLADSRGSAARKATTSSTGRYRFTVRPVARTEYWITFGGSSRYASSRSAKVTVAPRVVLSAPSRPSAVDAGQSFDVTGYLSPLQTAGEGRVLLIAERYSRGVWAREVTFPSVFADAGTRTLYSASLTLSPRGSWRIRAYSPPDASYAATYSAYRSITVR
jgi:hypothetical protein